MSYIFSISKLSCITPYWLYKLISVWTLCLFCLNGLAQFTSCLLDLEEKKSDLFVLFSGDLWSLLPTREGTVASTDGHILQGSRADWRRGKDFHWWILPVTSICRGCLWHASELQTHPLTWGYQQSDDAEVSGHLGAIWKRGVTLITPFSRIQSILPFDITFAI